MPLNWNCPRGHRFTLPPRIAVYRNRCPVCADYDNPSAPLPKGLTFAERMPGLISEWRDADHSPFDVSASSATKVLWRCSECGREWRTSVRERVKGSGCPTCGYRRTSASNRRQRLAKSGSLADHYPQLIAEFHTSKNGDLTAADLASSSHQKVWWRCACGHEWLSSPNQRILRGKICGCPKCANAKRSARLQAANRLRHIGKV